MEKLDLAYGKANRKSRKRRNKEALWGYAFVGPLLIGLLMFLAVPLGFSLYISLTEYSLNSAPVFVGFDHFKVIFTNTIQGKEFWRSIGNAFVMCMKNM